MSAVCQSLRIASFTVTQLPAPNYHCRSPAATAVKAMPAHWWGHLYIQNLRQQVHFPHLLSFGPCAPSMHPVNLFYLFPKLITGAEGDTQAWASANSGDWFEVKVSMYWFSSSMHSMSAYESYHLVQHSILYSVIQLLLQASNSAQSAILNTRDGPNCNFLGPTDRGDRFPVVASMPCFRFTLL